MPTSTGTMADHRLPLRAVEIEGFARQLAAAVGVSVPAGAAPSGKVPADFVSAVGATFRSIAGLPWSSPAITSRPSFTRWRMR